jgi:uncharacterized protein involved in cysteine biosynthesis
MSFGSAAAPAPAPGQPPLPPRPTPAPTPTGRSFFAQAADGLLQPLHAAALLLRDRELLVQALIPAGLLLLFCLWVGLFHALFSDETGIVLPMLKTALKIFVVLAPVPSIVMANHYSRLSALAHQRLCLGSCEPRRMPLVMSARRALRQVVVVAVAIAPLSFAARLLPLVGSRVAEALLLVWALLWIVIEALDDAAVEYAQAHAHAKEPPPALSPTGEPWVPWFLWPVQRAGTALPGLPGGPLRFFTRHASQLCAPWQHEIGLVARHPPVMVGFATATAALLCTPVLNLVFRPITIVAAVRLLGQLTPRPPALSPPSNLPPTPSPTPYGQGPC